MADQTRVASDPYGGVDPTTRPPRLTEVPSFVEYMKGSWEVPDRRPAVIPGAREAAAAHRARLSAAFPGRTIAVAAGSAPVRCNDNQYRFRADSNFVWLTNGAVEEAVLVMTPAGSAHDATLYIPPPSYPGDDGFFSDHHGEMWVGSAPSLGDWSAALGLEVRPLEGAAKAIEGQGEVLRAGAPDPALNDLPLSEDLARTLAELRRIKDAWEIDQLREAVNLTMGGFRAVAAELPAAIAGGGERWLQGTFERYCRTHGNDVGYGTIVGAGAHAPILHWERCDGPVRADDLVLMDMGGEVRSFYTGDLTRTLPASGTFSPVQRKVHDLVEKSLRAGMAEVLPGKPWGAFHHACMAVIAQGLSDWGLLPGVSVEEALTEGHQHRRWLICGIGHHIGLDVHDSSAAHRGTAGREQPPMAEGMVFTVEPGLYFHAHDAMVPPELRGVGVRLEQDLLVTATGQEILDAALPVDADGVEAWVRSAAH